MTPAELALRAGILAHFARTGAPPDVSGADPAALAALADQHVLVLDAEGRVVMAHPFAAPGGAAEVRAGSRVWWGNCAWDGLGLVAALGLRDAEVRAGDVSLRVRGGALADAALFHVAIPAARWWEDIADT